MLTAIASHFVQVTEFPVQNKHGLKNIIGNAWEWVQDWWTTSHSARPATNPVSHHCPRPARTPHAGQGGHSPQT